jgi:hypothetical protein
MDLDGVSCSGMLSCFPPEERASRRIGSFRRDPRRVGSARTVPRLRRGVRSPARYNHGWASRGVEPRDRTEHQLLVELRRTRADRPAGRLALRARSSGPDVATTTLAPKPVKAFDLGITQRALEPRRSNGRSEERRDAPDPGARACAPTPSHAGRHAGRVGHRLLTHDQERRAGANRASTELDSVRASAAFGRCNVRPCAGSDNHESGSKTDRP